MKWFRFYHEARHDPKIQNLRPELFRFWVNFLCVASAQDDRGRVPSEDHVRIELGLGRALTSRWLAELDAAGLIHRHEDGSLVPHNWTDRQPESDDSATRQRRLREASAEPRQNLNGAAPKLRQSGAETLPKLCQGATEVSFSENLGEISPGISGGANPQQAFQEAGCGDHPPEMSRDVSRDSGRDCHGDVAPRVRSDSDSDKEEEEEKKKIPKKKAVEPTIPDWIPLDAWDDYREMREAKKAPWTPGVIKRAINDLTKLRARGFAPRAVLDQSILCGYTGLFAVKNQDPEPEPEPPRKTYVAPLDGPDAEYERQNRAKLFALFGGTAPGTAGDGDHGQGGAGVAPEPGGRGVVAR